MPSYRDVRGLSCSKASPVFQCLLGKPRERNMKHILCMMVKRHEGGFLHDTSRWHLVAGLAALGSTAARQADSPLSCPPSHLRVLSKMRDRNRKWDWSLIQLPRRTFACVASILLGLRVKTIGRNDGWYLPVIPTPCYLLRVRRRVATVPRACVQWYTKRKWDDE
jgi:hypothetical protein